MRACCFLGGLVTGMAVFYGAATYHWLRTDQGLSFVPKQQMSLNEVFLDVREFGLSDWSRHPAVAAAIIENGQTGLFTAHAAEILTATSENLATAASAWPNVLR